jgi:hypothetical protein
MIIKTTASGLKIFTRMRWIIVLVAASAVFVWALLQAGRLREVSGRYRRMALYCANAEKTYNRYAAEYSQALTELRSNRLSKVSAKVLEGSRPGDEQSFTEYGARRSREAAHHWRELRRFYERAAMLPWISMSEDCQHPRWEMDIDPREDPDPY